MGALDERDDVERGLGSIAAEAPVRTYSAGDARRR